MKIVYPADLPISRSKDDIAAAIRDHQVVIVAGETGSGKTTQLPKICLELGRGQDRKIGHTQPRRIAARTVAERIAEELGTELGDVVGYKVRFTDRSSQRTQVRVMTDGILLAELQTDRDLRRYDTIIIDEAHERSLNIDFILGYLKRLLARRPDLRVVITSATIDPERFSRHFGDAPIIEVSGRTYPVEVRYRPLEDDQPAGIVDAVRELIAEGPGDILAFFSGEREIRDAADALAKLKPKRATDSLDILPLFSRLSVAEQRKVFAAHSGRRVVLATNVAETSLTVPGIKYVVDTGLARISRFSARTKVQRLPIEPISQASANQRKGRCGRQSDGICIRLYAEEDFAARPEFTEPEILRTNLASVILQMTSLGLGDVARFPFIEPPDTRSVQAGVQLLEELGAFAPADATPADGKGRNRGDRPRGGRQLTDLGRQLVQLPVDPRMGRMIIAATGLGCLREVVTIAAALSMQDPRERPVDKQEQADSKHRRFADPTSDFATIVNLWRYLREQQKESSSSRFRRMCKEDFLNYLRVREWQDLVSQLRRAAKQQGLRLNSEPASADAIHQALLAGLLSHIGLKDTEKRDYLGARGSRFSIFPGSALFKKQPDAVMAAELVETSRLWGRVNARIEPEWAETFGAHLVRRTYSEPHWSKKRGAVMAHEKVTLYGVPIVADRQVNYGAIDPEVARDLFIRHALVQGEWTTHHHFFRDNQALLEEAQALEHRARRRGIVVDEETLFDFYDARVPADVVSVAHFDAWWKRARHQDSKLLAFSLDMLVNDAAEEVAKADYPVEWLHQGITLPLTYSFDPGSDADGVTVEIPVTTLNQVDPDDFSWPVPGQRAELVVALIRSLPKQLRVNFVPAPNFARTFLASAVPGAEPLLDALERLLRRETGVVVPRDAWDLAKIPAHLRLSFRILDDEGTPIAESRDLHGLQTSLRRTTSAAIASAGAPIERTGLASWDFDELPRDFTETRAGHEVRGYPALVPDGDSVAIRVLSSEAEQVDAMELGTRRLLMLAVPSPAAKIAKALSNSAKLTLGLNPHGSIAALLADCLACAIDSIVAGEGGPVWDRAGFGRLEAAVRDRAEDRTWETVLQVEQVLRSWAEVDRTLSGRAEMSMLAALTDLKGQLARLVQAGFVAETGFEQLRHLPRYLNAMIVRIDKLRDDPRRDAVSMATMASVSAAYQHRIDALPTGRRKSAALRAVGWMIEELRVSLFAQQLGTAYPISPQRVERALADA